MYPGNVPWKCVNDSRKSKGGPLTHYAKQKRLNAQLNTLHVECRLLTMPNIITKLTLL